MTKKISGAEFPLAKIFSSDFDYSIPSYQRPYAWTEVQAGELFSDLVDFFTKEKDDTYFLGRSLDVFISRLRKYLKSDPKVQIVNVHGVGFKLVLDR